MDLPYDLRPNVPAIGHTRADYDFEQVFYERDRHGYRIEPGHTVMAPIRLCPVLDYWGNQVAPPKVWCKRCMMWETELS